MKLNIFWRMVVGFLITLLFVVVISSHSILRLSQLNEITKSIITVDQVSIETEKKMISSLLSQIRNEQKYLITRDKAFYKLFQAHQAEFIKYLNQLGTLLDNPEEKEFVNRINKLYLLYCRFVKKEITLLQTKGSFSGDMYEKEKNKTIDSLTENIDKLISLSQTTINNKVKYSKRIGGRAALIAEGLAIVSLILAIILSFFITRSINKPLKKLEAQTRSIADGNFQSRIEINSPAELAELAGSFNQMSDKLREIDEMKSGFISHISHELRTPLTSLIEANSLLLDRVAGSITEKQERLLKIIEQGANKLIGLINKLLDLSKMEAGMMEYNLVRTYISPLIRKSITEIRLLTNKKKIVIRSFVEEELPLANMDVEKIQLVINNILSNAVKFTPEKGLIEVNAKLINHKNPKAKSEDNYFIQVSIADTGPGIQKEYLNKIFDKFQQINPTANNAIKGTGLGLSIAKYIVEAHKGEIWVENNDGRGSTFTFLLPVYMGADIDAMGIKMEA